MNGTLYLCATPIGNLEDITIRVINTLKSVDLIAAEDTRHSIKLLNAYDINTPMTSYHEHNKISKGQYIIEQLKEGKNIALITDAGTPAISDPGEELVVMAYKEDIKVTSLPGASASITALTLSGLATDRFIFEGFLPSNKRDREIILKELVNETRTIIIYEAPHRLKKTLLALYSYLDSREITIIKEITKKYETIFQTNIKEAIDYFDKEDPKGEFVIVIKGKPYIELKNEEISNWLSMTVEEHMEYYYCQNIDKKEAMKLVAKDRGLGKRDIYNSLIKKKH